MKRVESTIEKQAVSSPSGEPEWVKKSACFCCVLAIVEEEKEERRMIAKGFRKYALSVLLTDRNENGEWERDPMVEFDSDEEPFL